MGFAQDWPRMNTLPEWFTVEPTKLYLVDGLEPNVVATRKGA